MRERSKQTGGREVRERAKEGKEQNGRAGAVRGSSMQRRRKMNGMRRPRTTASGHLKHGTSISKSIQ